MTELDKKIELIEKHKQELAKDYKVKKIGVFGSYVRGEQRKKSDIDIFLIAKEKKIDLDKYEKKLNRKIQMFFSENLSRLPKELQNNILNGIILSGFLRWKT